MARFRCTAHREAHAGVRLQVCHRRGGTDVLTVDGNVVAEQKMARTLPFILQWDENLDVGSDTGTPVNDSDYPSEYLSTSTALSPTAITASFSCSFGTPNFSAQSRTPQLATLSANVPARGDWCRRSSSMATVCSPGSKTANRLLSRGVATIGPRKCQA